MGLCLGGDFVLQGANSAIRVFDRSGTPLTDTTPLNQLCGAPPAVIRSVPTFGDFIGDVKCYYDPEVQRFFVSSFRVPTDPATGGYVVEGGAGTAPWRDYSAATADDVGHLWVAKEYIPRACPTTADIGTTANACRSLFANWGTFVTHVVP
jgi:hypothetical protein